MSTTSFEHLKPSGRGELEITDVNNAYIERNEMTWEELEGWWTDAGTFESLLRASNLVAETGANKMELTTCNRNRQPMSESFKIGEISGVVVHDLRSLWTRADGWPNCFARMRLDPEFYPVMVYTSATNPGITRGPHEHVDQADFFCFIGPSSFKLRLWDNRRQSPTYNNVMTMVVGEENPKSVLVPAGVVHAYQNIGPDTGIVVNCPNRLYMGEGKREKIDEIRHEDDPQTIYRMD